MARGRGLRPHRRPRPQRRSGRPGAGSAVFLHVARPISALRRDAWYCPARIFWRCLPVQVRAIAWWWVPLPSRTALRSACRQDSPLAEAIELHRAGRIVEASRLFESILKDEPRNLAALQHLAIIHASRGEFEFAEVLFRRAAEAAPDNPDVQSNLGRVLSERGRHEEAVACLNRALSLRPGMVEAEFNLGALHHKMGHPGGPSSICAVSSTVSPILLLRSACSPSPFRRPTRTGRSPCSRRLWRRVRRKPFCGTHSAACEPARARLARRAKISRQRSRCRRTLLGCSLLRLVRNPRLCCRRSEDCRHGAPAWQPGGLEPG